MVSHLLKHVWNCNYIIKWRAFNRNMYTLGTRETTGTARVIFVNESLVTQKMKVVNFKTQNGQVLVSWAY